MELLKNFYFAFLSNYTTWIRWKLKGADGVIFGNYVCLDSKGTWRWIDNGAEVPMNGKIIDVPRLGKTCPKCKLPPTDDGHDPCIASLPGVKYACCGHGIGHGYIAFNSGKVERFVNLPERFRQVKKVQGF